MSVYEFKYLLGELFLIAPDTSAKSRCLNSGFPPLSASHGVQAWVVRVVGLAVVQLAAVELGRRLVNESGDLSLDVGLGLVQLGALVHHLLDLLGLDVVLSMVEEESSYIHIKTKVKYLFMLYI